MLETPLAVLDGVLYLVGQCRHELEVRLLPVVPLIETRHGADVDAGKIVAPLPRNLRAVLPFSQVDVHVGEVGVCGEERRVVENVAEPHGHVFRQFVPEAVHHVAPGEEPGLERGLCVVDGEPPLSVKPLLPPGKAEDFLWRATASGEHDLRPAKVFQRSGLRPFPGVLGECHHAAILAPLERDGLRVGESVLHCPHLLGVHGGHGVEF